MARAAATAASAAAHARAGSSAARKALTRINDATPVPHVSPSARKDARASAASSLAVAGSGVQ